MSDDSWVSASAPYISPRQSGQTDAWSSETAQRGRRGGQKTLAVEEVIPPVEVQDALRLEPGGTAVVRRRLILLDDSPIELTDSYYPAAIAAGTRLADPRKIPGGAVTLLAELGYLSAEVEEDVSAGLATEAERETLNLPVGSAVLKLIRTSRTASGAPFEVSVMTMPPDRHLHYRLGKQAS
jgi:DNA-binding GntR family transcriptional regulator